MVVYTHTRLDTNVIFYVGIGKTEKRAYSKHGRTNYWRYIVAKGDYSVEIVHECETWDEACYTEKYLIAYYGRRNLGLGELCNLTDGGDGQLGFIKSKETCAKISNSKIGHKVSNDTRAKISATKKGKKLSDEHRAKISLGGIGRKQSAETRAKTSASLKGRVFSEETLAKMRLWVPSAETIAKRTATLKANKLLKKKTSE